MAGPAPPRATGGPVPPRLVAPVLVAIACVPFVVAVAQVASSGWVPVSDDAVTAVLTDDVLSFDTPQLGMRSTAGDGTGNHPGPMLFWVMAPLAAVSGSAPWSYLLSIAVLACACVVGIALTARRAAGTGALVGALAVTMVMSLSLGRQLIVDVWNPHAAVLPFLLSLFVVWAVASGWSWGLPLAALGLSFVAQAHLVYVPLAAVLLLAAVLVVVRGPRPWPPVAAAAGVGALVWALPLFEQLTSDEGNVTKTLAAADAEGGAGYGWAVGALARAVGVVPSWVAPARWTADEIEPGTPPLTALTAVVVVAAVVGLGVGAWRRRDRVAVAAAGTAVLTLVAATAVLATMPREFGAGVPQWRYLFTWAAGAFTWFALGLLVARVAGDRVGRALVGVSGVVVVVAVVAIPFADAPPRGNVPLRHAVGELAPELASAVEGLGPLRVDAYGYWELDRYGFFHELQRRGVDVRVRPDDEYLGEEYPGGDDLPALVVVGGDADPPLSGATLVRSWDEVRPGDRARLEVAEARVRAWFGDGARLTTEGRTALAEPADEVASALRAVQDGDADLEAFRRLGAGREAFERGWLDPGSRDEALALLREWDAARSEVDARLLRVYLVGRPA